MLRRKSQLLSISLIMLMALTLAYTPLCLAKIEPQLTKLSNITETTPFFPNADIRTQFINPGQLLRLTITAQTLDNSAKVFIAKIENLNKAYLENPVSQNGQGWADIVWQSPNEEGTFYCDITAASIKNGAITFSQTVTLKIVTTKNINNESARISPIIYPLETTKGAEFLTIIEAKRLLASNQENLDLYPQGLENLLFKSFTSDSKHLKAILWVPEITENPGIYLLCYHIFDTNDAYTYLEIPVKVKGA